MQVNGVKFLLEFSPKNDEYHYKFLAKRKLHNEQTRQLKQLEYPMPDAAHVRAAEAYFRYCPEELKPELARAILKRAKEFGVDVESPTVLQYAEE